MNSKALERTIRFLRACVWLFCLLAILALATRFFVGDVYPVSTPSMRPTIFAGAAAPGDPASTEWVFVSYDRSPPKRFDLVVVRREDSAEPLVKRVVGLPGETLRLANGDLFVNGRPLGALDPAVPLLPLWDSDFQPIAKWLSCALFPKGPWRSEEGVLVLDGAAENVQRALARLRPMARDGYLSPAGEHVAGMQPVNDLALELIMTLEPGGPKKAALLSATLTEQGDAFTLALERAAGGGEQQEVFEAKILRRTSSAFEEGDASALRAEEGELLARGSVSLRLGRTHVLRFSNVDNQLRVVLDGKSVLETSYERNRTLQRPGSAAQHVSPRIAFGGQGLRVRFERIRVLRDLYWGAEGNFALHSDLLLGPDEIFVLGDNTRASTDSRSFGPLGLERIRGRAKAVVWPLSRLRRL